MSFKIDLNKKNLQIVIHAAVWAGFLLLPFISFSGPKEMPFNPERKLQLLFFINNLFLIGFYYLHGLLLIPRLLAERKIMLYMGAIFALLAVFICIPVVYFHFVDLPHPKFNPNTQPPNGGHGPGHFGWRRMLPFSFPGSILMFMLIFVISGGIKIINQWFKSELRSEEIEREKITTELALLKMQVNPHFLFNTLNNIYALAVTNSADTAPAVMKLSGIMRYVLDEAKTNFVPLEREISFLQNYISLQKMRLTDKTVIKFSATGDIDNKQIAPLLLIAFVENAFKYGVSTHHASVVDFSLTVTGKQLLFKTTNEKPANGYSTGNNNTGIGLKNTRRRLELIYPDKYTLQITDNPDAFFTILTIDLP